MYGLLHPGGRGKNPPRVSDRPFTVRHAVAAIGIAIVMAAGALSPRGSTVPNGKPLSVLLTHDIDYARAWDNSLQYAAAEHEAGVHATYFVQTKYVRDYSDEIFFTEAQRRYLHVLDSLGATDFRRR